MEIRLRQRKDPVIAVTDRPETAELAPSCRGEREFFASVTNVVVRRWTVITPSWAFWRSAVKNFGTAVQ